MKNQYEALRAYLAHNYPAILSEAFDLIKRHDGAAWHEFCYGEGAELDDATEVVLGWIWCVVEDNLSPKAIELIKANMNQVKMHMEYANIFDADISPLEAEQRWEHLCSITDHGQRQRAEDAFWHSIAN